MESTECEAIARGRLMAGVEIESMVLFGYSDVLVSLFCFIKVEQRMKSSGDAKRGSSTRVTECLLLAGRDFLYMGSQFPVETDRVAILDERISFVSLTSLGAAWR